MPSAILFPTVNAAGGFSTAGRLVVSGVESAGRAAALKTLSDQQVVER
jgi:hypothetical protein